jgi:hypothetical protein
MRSTVFSGSLLLFGVVGLWSSSARAILNCEAQCPCGGHQVCEASTYTPARYTAGANGDVALSANNGTPANEAMYAIAQALGLSWYHAKLLYDSTGNHFTETFWDGSAPPSSHTTGEPDWCSRVVSPFYLARLSPGAGFFYEDAVSGELVKAFGRPSCTSLIADSYHFNSFLYDDVYGGSCERLLVDECGVPVNEALTSAGGDRTGFTGPQVFSALTQVWNEAFASAMDTLNGFSWLKDILVGFECGETPQTTMAQRAAWQVVNEVYYKAQPLQVDAGWDSGWSDFNNSGAAPPLNGPFPPPNYATMSGTMLGAGKTIWESLPNGAEPTCSGICNNGSCNNAPIACGTAYSPGVQTGNFPDNIAHAASRLGAAQVQVMSGSGITAGYTTCTEYGCDCMSCCAHGECED